MLNLVFLLLYNGASPWSSEENNLVKLATILPGASEYLKQYKQVNNNNLR